MTTTRSFRQMDRIGRSGYTVATITLDEMLVDLKALYSGKTVAITVENILADLHSLYAEVELPITMNDIARDLQALYGNMSVIGADFISDFQALYAAPMNHRRNVLVA